MFDADYKRGMEAIGPSDAQMERTLSALEQAGDGPAKTAKHTVRTVLLAAALCAALAVTALAVELTVGWENFFGRTPKEAVTTVGTSAVTGDYTFTLQESIVDDDGAAFLLALTRNDGGVIEGDPQLSGNTLSWDVKVDGQMSIMSLSEPQRSIRSEDGKTIYYCMEFEGESAESLLGKNITFLCKGLADMDWSEEELAMTQETVSLATFASTTRKLDMSYGEISRGQYKSELLALVEELSSQTTVPLTRLGEGKTRISAVFFTSDGLAVAVDCLRGRVCQGNYLFSGTVMADTLTDTRTGESWRCKGATRRQTDEGDHFFLSDFRGCPLTEEDLPYMEVTVSYTVEKVLSDQEVELSFSTGVGQQITIKLDEDIAFNYIGDCTAHVTEANISALRLQLTFDQMERSGWNWEDHKVRETQWALLEKDGTRVLLFSPIIRQDEKTGTGYIRLEGVDENNDRRLIDPDQVEALLVGDTVIPLT